jgi:hypothetical protein
MTIKARFDGKAFVPEEPLDFPKDQPVLIEILSAPSEPHKPMTAGELANSEWVGAWADRKDITDSTEFVNDIRRRIERREL